MTDILTDTRFELSYDAGDVQQISLRDRLAQWRHERRIARAVRYIGHQVVGLGRDQFPLGWATLGKELSNDELQETATRLNDTGVYFRIEPVDDWRIGRMTDDYSYKNVVIEALPLSARPAGRHARTS